MSSGGVRSVEGESATLRTLTDPIEVSALLGVPFTDDQLAAIGAPPEPLVVIAGAGSGKTSVMAARVVWLVGSGQVRPEQVLGLTFTNKAAAELGHRVRSALSALVVDVRGRTSADLSDVGEPTVSTYHAYAARLLTEQGLRLGVEPDARMLTDALRFQLAQRVLRRAPGPFPSFDKGLARLAEQLLDLDAEIAEHLVSTEAVREHDRALLDQLSTMRRLTTAGRTAQDTARARLDLLGLVDELQDEKRRMSLLDFGDQLALTARLVNEHPDVGAAERDRYRVVLLDEYQDTSVAQKSLLLEVFGRGHAVTAVGDPFQAIYGWRGASVLNIGTFADEFRTASGAPATLAGLMQNNRSGERILDVANTISAPLREATPSVQPLTARQDLRATGRVDAALFLTADAELAWGADFVRDAIASGREPHEIAVLSRTAVGIAAWHHALTVRGIPVEVVGLGGLLELPEIVDLVCTLSVLDDPTANPAMVRLLTGPRWRLGPSDLKALGQRASTLVRGRTRHVDGGGAPTELTSDADQRLRDALADAVAETDESDIVSLLDAALDPGDAALTRQARQRLGVFAAEFERLRAVLALPLPDLVASVITTMGLDVEVAVRDGAERRSEALSGFAQVVADFSDLDGEVTLRGLLAFLSVAGRDDRRLSVAVPSGANSVTLMTMHAAKGLEFPVVVMPDVTAGVFPSKQSRRTFVSEAGALPLSLRGDAADFPPAVSDWSGEQGLKAFKAAMSAHAETEERRLAYVALTRAKEHVVVTSHWWGPTQKKPRGPSPYLLAIKAAVEAGAGSVVEWEPEPDEAQNPFLGHASDLAWPAPIDADAMAGRTAAARAVSERIDILRRGEAFAAPELTGEAAELAAAWQRDTGVLAAELRAAHAPVTHVPMPQSLTASAVLDLRADPQAFAQRLRRPMPRPPAVAARRGTRFHAWVEERFGQRALLDRDDLLGAADDADVINDVQLRDLQAAFEAGPFADRVPFAVEVPFQIVLAGRVIRGRIDAVYAEGNGFDVIDWKTGRSTADPTQLALYRWAWAAQRGIPDDDVTAGFYVVPEGRVDRPELPTREDIIATLSGEAASATE